MGYVVYIYIFCSVLEDIKSSICIIPLSTHLNITIYIMRSKKQCYGLNILKYEAAMTWYDPQVDFPASKEK